MSTHFRFNSPILAREYQVFSRRHPEIRKLFDAIVNGDESFEIWRYVGHIDRLKEALIGFPSLSGWLENYLDIESSKETTLELKISKYETVIDVQDYGATGSGEGDDYHSIQTALNDICSMSTPEVEVYFPHGRYLVYYPLLLKCNTKEKIAKVRISLHPAARLVFKYKQSTPRGLFEFGPEVDQYYGSIVLEGGEINGGVEEADPFGDNDGIRIQSGNVTVQNMLIQEFKGSGVVISNEFGGRSSEIGNRIVNCNILKNNGSGVLGSSANGLTIERCRITGNHMHGVHIYGGNDIVITNNNIEGNNREKKAGGGTKPSSSYNNLLVSASDSGDASNITISNNRFEDTDIGGYQYRPAVSIEGTKVTDNPPPYYSVRPVSFLGNHITSFTIYGGLGIGQDGPVDEVTVVGNYLTGSGGRLHIGEYTQERRIGPNRGIVDNPFGLDQGMFLWDDQAAGNA